MDQSTSKLHKDARRHSSIAKPSGANLNSKERKASIGPSPLSTARHSLENQSQALLPPPKEPQPRRKSSFFNLFSNKQPKEQSAPRLRAWIIPRDQEPEVAYDVASLVLGRAMPELWDDKGDTFVHLFPQASWRSPTFRVSSSIFASSKLLKNMARQNPVDPRRVSSDSSYGTLPSTPEFGPLDTYAASAAYDFASKPPQLMDLFLPVQLGSTSPASGVDAHISDDDLNILITVRNLFAFLVGQSLVATERQRSIFSIFSHISDLLKAYEFSSLDGSTFGEAAAGSFDFYADELRLADCRGSCSKIVAALVLAERMHSAKLYNEAYSHAVGNYPDIQHAAKQSQDFARKFNMISRSTIKKIEADYDRLGRIEISVNSRLVDLDFPSIFSGIGSSKTAEERKTVNFEGWKDSFNNVRRHILNFYKSAYGSWPPKASSKKNTFTTSGFNRMVLQSIYRDFSDWYDLMVNRHSPTTRNPSTGASYNDHPAALALRRIFDEYDRSHPPVQPAIPYDVPMLPSLSMTRSDYGKGDEKKDARARHKKLKDDELNQLLKLTCNQDVLRHRVEKSPFLTALRTFETKQARGCNVSELLDLRAGMWIFMYAVIQALPLLVVDAPGVRYGSEIEYFLCMPALGPFPWTSTRHSTAGSSAAPSGQVEYSVDAVYRHSHCWLAAHAWSPKQAANVPSTQVQGIVASRKLPVIKQIQPQPNATPSSDMDHYTLPHPRSVSLQETYAFGAGQNRKASLPSQTWISGSTHSMPPALYDEGAATRPAPMLPESRSWHREHAQNLGIDALPPLDGGTAYRAGRFGATTDVSCGHFQPPKTFDEILHRKQAEEEEERRKAKAKKGKRV